MSLPTSRLYLGVTKAYISPLHFDSLLFIDILSAPRQTDSHLTDSIHGNPFSCGVQDMADVTPMVRNCLGTLTDKRLILIDAGGRRGIDRIWPSPQTSHNACMNCNRTDMTSLEFG